MDPDKMNVEMTDLEYQLRARLREAKADRNDAAMLLKEVLPFIGYPSDGNEKLKQKIESFLVSLPWRLDD